ncbi:MAG: hypothetical protein JO210_16180 [Acidobacteriaceae bacterium]|nr:hypothetical protein [Acidobacteriaceae bacterium]
MTEYVGFAWGTLSLAPGQSLWFLFGGYFGDPPQIGFFSPGRANDVTAVPDNYPAQVEIVEKVFQQTTGAAIGLPKAEYLVSCLCLFRNAGNTPVYFRPVLSSVDIAQLMAE